jgi:hypothetical protein
MLLLEAPIVVKNQLLGSAYEKNKNETPTQNIKGQIFNILLIVKNNQWKRPLEISL